MILFTEELPEGMFKLILIPMRWQSAATPTATGWSTEYPPFDWDE